MAGKDNNGNTIFGGIQDLGGALSGIQTGDMSKQELQAWLAENTGR